MVNPFNRVPYAGECRLNIRTAKGLKVNQVFQRERGKQEAGPVYGDGKYNPLESQERGWKTGCRKGGHGLQRGGGERRDEIERYRGSRRENGSVPHQLKWNWFSLRGLEWERCQLTLKPIFMVILPRADNLIKSRHWARGSARVQTLSVSKAFRSGPENPANQNQTTENRHTWNWNKKLFTYKLYKKYVLFRYKSLYNLYSCWSPLDSTVLRFIHELK